jgi:hypothetical protein
LTALLLVGILCALPRGCDLLWGNAPMTAYGKVIDQMGNAVPGADVTFQGRAMARLQLPILWTWPRESTWQIHTHTSNDGSFILHGGWGQRMYWASIDKSGYSQGIVPGSFYFGSESAKNTLSSTAQHPAVFMWWNNRLKRVLSRDVMCRPDRLPYTLEYLRGRVSHDTGVLAHIEFTVLRPLGNLASPYNWSLSVRAPNGRICEANGPLKREAPQEGYVRELNYTMGADNRRWSPEITTRFYTRESQYPSGPETFAGVELIAVFDSNGNPTVTIHYTANFGNSRDLTPGPVKPAPH